MKKTVSGITLMLLFIGVLTLAFNIQPVKGSGTIYIRADGSVDPDTAPISSVDNVTYTFTDNIYDEIVVERNNIVVDGAGYFLQGTGSGTGIYLARRSNVTIKNMEIKFFWCGIWLSRSSNNTISGNNITNNLWQGIWLRYSSNNTISGNNITEYNEYGIRLDESSNNTLSANNITNNLWHGIWLVDSSNNTINENNIANNLYGDGVELHLSSNNTISGNNITGNNKYGIELHLSSNNTINGNNITNNLWYGIWLYESSNNTLRNNDASNNKYNFDVCGSLLSHYIHDIDNSNTVDGKPIYYWISRLDMAVPLDAGYVALINCTNITAQNLKLINNGQGILLNFTTNSTITKNNITNNGYGIRLYRSSNNTISGNNITENNEYGIRLDESSNNTLRNNDASNNKYNFGVYDESLSHYIHDIDNSNTVNDKPIYYWINRRDMAVPLDAGYVALINCTNITLKNLNLNNNAQGVLLILTTNSTINKNTMTNNHWDGIHLYGSSSNIIAGNTITNNHYGMRLDDSSDNTINGNTITNNEYGIRLFISSNNNTISGNNITANDYEGIKLYHYSNSNTVSGNTITNNLSGIMLDNSSNNTIAENNISNNECGIALGVSSYNRIYHNNFMDNTRQVICFSINYGVWDNGYPSGGNYWDDYAGIDSDHDGIGDSWHEINQNNADHFPLMGMFSSFNTSVGKCVNVISNSTIEDFEYSQDNSTIRMYVSNMTANQTFGFCRVCIPHTLMNVSNISVIIDDEAVEVLHFNNTIYDNDTHRWIYFAYEHSTHEIVIIPELPSFLILPLFMIATALAVIVYRKKYPIRK